MFKKDIINRKRQVFYPLFTIFVTFLIYWILSLFIDFADSETVFPFLFLTLDLFILRYFIDNIIHHQKENDNFKNISFLLIFIIGVLSILLVTSLVLLLLIDLFYLIPITIHFLAIIIIYFFLKHEVKKYFSIKSLKNDNVS